MPDCDMSYIGKIEQCESFTNIKIIKKLANALGFHVKGLFDFEYDLDEDK